MKSYKELYKRICRLCLSVNSIANPTCLTGKSNNKHLSYFGKAIMFLCNIKLTNTNKLPQFICENCKQLLNQAISFRLRCESSDKKLRRLMKVNVDKTQSIQKVICEYVLFNQHFPSKSISLTQNNTSINNKHENLMKNGLKSEFMITSDDEQKCERLSINNSNVTSENGLNRNEENNTNTTSAKLINSKEIESILDTIEENINTDNFFDDTAHNYDDKQESDYEIKSETNIPKNKAKMKTEISSKPKEIDEILNSIDYIINSENTSYQKKLSKRKIKGEVIKTPALKRNIECHICHRILANQLTYKYHMQRHNICQYICEQCGKGFPVVNELRRHQANLHGLGGHLKCDHCPFKAAEKIDLVEHIRKHTGERPFTCEKCGLTFRRRAIYKNHLVYHGEKKYKCGLCAMMFYRQSELDSHNNNIHERKYVYMCRVCNITYTKTATVRRHMINKHGIAREMQGRIIRVINGSIPETN